MVMMIFASRNELSEEVKKYTLLYLGSCLVKWAGALLCSGGVMSQHVMTIVLKAVAKAGWYPILKRLWKSFGVILLRRGFGKGMESEIPIVGLFQGINLCDYENHGRKIAKGIIQTSQL